jgi:D-alanine-D-alanine ligase
MTKKVLVLTGGFSAEREVSLSAGKDIAEALRLEGYEVVLFDLTDSWQLVDVLKQEKPDVVFNGLYGNWGEDGAIQGMLDLLQIPYTHSGMKASMLGMDKNLTREVASSCGIKVAKGQKMTAKQFVEQGTTFAMPYVVKPVSDGSSVGVYIIRKPEDLAEVKYDDMNREVLVEAYIPGRELTVMCLEGKAYVVTELRATKEFYDYEAKYTNGMTRHVLPAEIPDDVAALCKDYAERLHKALGCRTVSRTDFRWNENDGVVLLEINTNPGMTALSLVPEQAKYVGISYGALCAKLVENACCRPM